MEMPKKPQQLEPFVWTPFVSPSPTDPHYEFFSDVQKQLAADHSDVPPVEDLLRVLNANISQNQQEAADQLATLDIQLVPVGKKPSIVLDWASPVSAVKIGRNPQVAVQQLNENNQVPWRESTSLDDDMPQMTDDFRQTNNEDAMWRRVRLARGESKK